MSRYASIFICAAVSLLLALGLTMLASTSAWVKGYEEPYHFFTRQVGWTIIGTAAAVAAAFFHPKWLRKWWPWMLAGVSVLLALCFVPGVGMELLGSKRWIKLPLLGQFQPSEVAKIVCVLALGGWYARWQSETATFWRGFVLPGVMVGVPVLLIGAETDVGSALSLSVAIACIMFCVGVRLWYLIPTAVLAFSGAAFYVYHNENRWSRILAWLDLEANQLDKGQQQWRAIVALGNGGVTGVGLGNGSEKYGMMAFAHIDFIFPMIGEELGLIGALATVFCYLVFAVAGCLIAAQASNVFDRCLALGMTAMVVVPAMVNIAVTTAVLPNDGLPLPFVSYGGTTLVFTLAGVGLLCGVHRRSRVELRQGMPVSALTTYAVKL